MHPALTEIVRNGWASLKPPPPLTVSMWAERYAYLPSESSSTHGKYKVDRTEFVREIMDTFSDPRVKETVVMSSAQVAKTTIANMVIGLFVHYDPSPILLVQPTLELAEAWSKDKFAPMVRDTPVLAALIKDARARDSGNTILHKTYPGGQLTVCGANSPASLASRSKRVILLDEVDRYPKSAGTEGDPAKLAIKRADTFPNRRIGFFSTPTIKGESAIEKKFLAGDQRYFHVPCPHCGHEQRLRWSNVKWQGDDSSTARYLCEHPDCGALWTDGERHRAVRQGRWVASQPFNGIASFHIWMAYSPFIRLEKIVDDFLDAKRGGPESMKTFVNRALGECWEKVGTDKQDPDTLKARAESYEPLKLQAEDLVLTMGVDTQNDRLAVKIKSWRRGERSRLIWWGELWGDPSEGQVFEQLEELITRTFPHPSGHDIGISAVAIDTGGHRTQYVYDYCRKARLAGLPVFAIKGSNSRTADVIDGRPSKADIRLNGRVEKDAIQLFSIGVSRIKDLIAARIRLTDPTKPGYMSWYEAGDDYFKQMTSEVAAQRFVQGQLYYVWEKVSRDARNEAWDCEVYAYAAARLIGIERAVWDNLERRFAVNGVDAPADEPKPEQPPPPTRGPALPPGFRVVGRRGGLPSLGGLPRL